MEQTGASILPWLAIGVFAYIMGSIPSGYLLGRFRGVDIRSLGSGNIGATNVFRCLGKKLGALTLVVDFLKGLLPVMTARYVFSGGDSDAAAVMAAAFSVAGHVWPVTMRFRGGKGVATAAGALLGIVPLAMALALVVWVVLFLAAGYVSLASITAAVAVTVAVWLLHSGEKLLIPVVVTLLAAITLWRHRGNMRRLINGTEFRSCWWRRLVSSSTGSAADPPPGSGREHDTV